MSNTYSPIQTAGNASVSPLLMEVINQKTSLTGFHTLWNYTTQGANTQIPTGFIPTGYTALNVAPVNITKSNAQAPDPTMEAFTSYNNLALTFKNAVRVTPLISATTYMGALINVDSSKTNSTLLRIVAETGATANATIRTVITVSSTIYMQIDATLPLANTRYVIDDIQWQKVGTQGAINLPVIINGVSTGTVQAVVTTVGVVPAGAIYKAMFVTGTLGVMPISNQLYSNEQDKYGAKINHLFCCKVETLAKFEKELQETKCVDSISGSYTKAKMGTVSVRLQKYNVAAEALLSGSTMKEMVLIYALPPVKVKAVTSGANIVVPATGTDIANVSVDCASLQKATPNLTSALLLGNQWSYNTVTGEITLPLSVPSNTIVEVAYNTTTTGAGFDPMELTGENEGRLSWTKDSTNKKGKRVYSLPFASVSLEDSLEDEGDTLDAEFKLLSTEGLSIVAQI